MTIDQAHEQANAIIKADGGTIGLPEDPSALRRLMVAGPEALGNNPALSYEPIKKNRTDFFMQGSTSMEPSMQKLLKEDCWLFTKLFISCQSKKYDPQEFFQHEKQALKGCTLRGLS
ncbi:hypothetical protein CRENBAI_014387 [Crenichthys baileyi]|uniref:Uncharacterized protein n=1 Tax=Crenichthys baileyi TaxID=28760 RepID=A0AAV9RRW4_9TELE